MTTTRTKLLGWRAVTRLAETEKRVWTFDELRDNVDGVWSLLDDPLVEIDWTFEAVQWVFASQIVEVQLLAQRLLKGAIFRATGLDSTNPRLLTRMQMSPVMTTTLDAWIAAIHAGEGLHELVFDRRWIDVGLEFLRHSKGDLAIGNFGGRSWRDVNRCVELLRDFAARIKELRIEFPFSRALDLSALYNLNCVNLCRSSDLTFGPASSLTMFRSLQTCTAMTGLVTVNDIRVEDCEAMLVDEARKLSTLTRLTLSGPGWTSVWCKALKEWTAIVIECAYAVSEVCIASLRELMTHNSGVRVIFELPCASVEMERILLDELLMVADRVCLNSPMCLETIQRLWGDDAFKACPKLSVCVTNDVVVDWEARMVRSVRAMTEVVHVQCLLPMSIETAVALLEALPCPEKVVAVSFAVIPSDCPTMNNRLVEAFRRLTSLEMLNVECGPTTFDIACACAECSPAFTHVFHMGDLMDRDTLVALDAGMRRLPSHVSCTSAVDPPRSEDLSFANLADVPRCARTASVISVLSGTSLFERDALAHGSLTDVTSWDSRLDASLLCRSKALRTLHWDIASQPDPAWWDHILGLHQLQVLALVNHTITADNCDRIIGALRSARVLSSLLLEHVCIDDCDVALRFAEGLATLKLATLELRFCPWVTTGVMERVCMNPYLTQLSIPVRAHTDFAVFRELIDLSIRAHCTLVSTLRDAVVHEGEYTIARNGAMSAKPVADKATKSRRLVIFRRCGQPSF